MATRPKTTTPLISLEPTPEMVAKWLEQFPRHPDVLELAVDNAILQNKGRATPDIEPLINRRKRGQSTPNPTVSSPACISNHLLPLQRGRCQAQRRRRGLRAARPHPRPLRPSHPAP